MDALGKLYGTQEARFTLSYCLVGILCFFCVYKLLSASKSQLIHANPEPIILLNNRCNLFMAQLKMQDFVVRVPFLFVCSVFELS